jgi:hypothetical protein
LRPFIKKPFFSNRDMISPIYKTNIEQQTLGVSHDFSNLYTINWPFPGLWHSQIMMWFLQSIWSIKKLWLITLSNHDMISPIYAIYPITIAV